MKNAREDLRQRILMMLVRCNVPNAVIEVDSILNDYEISERTTEIALLREDRNEYLLKKFLMAKIVKGCTDRTIDRYKKDLTKALTEINKNIDDITTDDIRYYLAIRQKRDGVSKTTANNELRAISTFYQWLTAEEIIGKNPVLRIEKIKEDKKKKHAFTDIEIEKIRNAAKNNKERAIVEMLLSTGCRITELVNIKISDVKGDKLVVRGKGNKERTVYLNAKAVIALEKYLDERSDNNPYVFCGGVFSAKLEGDAKSRASRHDGRWYIYPDIVKPDMPQDKGSIEGLLRNLGKRAQIETSVHPHKFRRTCATFALRRGMPIEQVSHMLGHESIETTQIYLDLNEQDLEQAHKKYVY